MTGEECQLIIVTEFGGIAYKKSDQEKAAIPLMTTTKICWGGCGRSFIRSSIPES
jgi:hypothetical protein